ncbi:MAG: alcohol dehydrogenase catalytic domain-containing protein [Hyphomicrobiales bacterium]|nr:alcohol dehydrogenase catalytic domain-containing protein [Hyphomicrobiales bacterium]MCP5372279.1 alcohol dehydrogenase catalytic domain-containing protein [Hyphomicrobiales bacterium]
MGLQFKAAVLREAGRARPYAESQPLVLEDVTVEGPGAGEVLVRIAAASLCRSDLSVVTGVRAWPMPIVPGHEASGVVEEVGAGVATLRRGDPVVLVFQPQCGVCPSCLAGDAHLCGPGLAANRAGELMAGGTRLVSGGAPVHHHMGLSAFAQYAVVSEKSVVPMPEGIPLEVGALFGCAVMCGAGTVLNTGGVRPGDTVTIAGAGGVGCSAILGAVLAGAERIVVVDRDADHLDVALDLGATDAVLDEDGTAAARVLELTGGGTDHAFETAGTLGAFETAYNSVRRGGQVVTVGLVDPRTPFALDIAALVTGAKTLRGSYIGSCNPRRDIPRYMALYQRGSLPVDRLITHRLTLAEVNTALDRMSDARALRQIILP